MSKNSISCFTLLAAACFLAITPFFWYGSPSGHDFEFHMFSWMEVLGQWKQGIFYPRWAALAHWGYGEARFLFYPPASWTLGATLGAFLPWKVVPGAYCWLVLTLAGASMYRLAREWLAPRDSIFASIFYAINPYHLLIVYWRSAYAELLAAALLPLLLLLLLRLNSSQDSKSSLRTTLYLSLLLAAAWLTNAPAAIMVHYSVAGLASVLAVQARLHSEKFWPLILKVASATLLGAGLAAFYLVPTTYEQSWINLSEVMAPGVRPQDNFLFTTIADPDHNRFNLLVSMVALAEIGVLILAIWFSRRRRSSDAPSQRISWTLLTAWGAATVILMLPISNLLWEHLPKFRYVQLPFRWLLCMNAAVALLLTMATKRWILRAATCAALLFALVFVGYRTQPPWWDNAADIKEMSDAVSDGTGYEGVDEYVPAGADPYEIKKDAPRVADETGAPIATSELFWSATEERFRVETAQPENLTVRLFNYPAWDVTVNDHQVETAKAEVTGLMIVPVGAGVSEVDIRLRRTIDRLVGDIISLVSLIVLLILWMITRIKRSQFESAT